MAVEQNHALPRQKSWLQYFFRRVRLEEMTAEERFEYTQFLFRVRSFIIIKACINGLIVILYLFTLLPEWPWTVLVASVDGLLLIPYSFLVRRWPVLTTTALLTITALAISAADAVSGWQTSTSGVFYAVLIVAAAVILLHPRSTAIVTASVTAVFLLTYFLEVPFIWGREYGPIPVKMTLETSRAMIRVVVFHTLTFIGVGTISSILTRLYRQLLETRSQRGLLTALLQGFQEISADLDLPTLLQRIVERAVSTLPSADRAVLLLQENDEMVVRAAAGYASLSPVGLKVPLSSLDEALGEAPTQIQDLPELLGPLLSPETRALLSAVPPGRATIVFPMRIHETYHILLAVTNTQRPDAFDAETQQILDIFAHQAAVAIENAQLFAEAQSRLQEALAMHRVGQEISSLLQMHDLVPAIHQHIKQTMEAPSFAIALQDPRNGELTLLPPIDSGEVFPDMTVSPEGIAGWVVRNRRVLRLANVPQDLPAYPDIRPQHFGHTELVTRSLLAVPLMVGNQVIGAMSVQSTRPNAYSERDERLLSSLANYVAVAVQNARLYDELQHKAQELQQKQSELQGLVAAVYQRLHRPVEALAGFTQLFLEGRDHLTPEENDYLERMERNARWISQMIQDMLFLSRMGQVSEEREPIALSTLARGVSTHLELERQGVAVSIQEDMPTLYADPVLMWTFLRNLLQNAHRLLWAVPSPRIEVGCVTLAETYRLHIQGNGESLPAADLEHLFELFYPVGSADGAGIGLAIAQRIGQHYSARVWAEAGKDSGTTFYVMLPKTLARNPEGPSHG